MDKIILPSLLERYLSHYWVKQKHLAYCFFNSDEILQEFGGDMDFYFPDGIASGIRAMDLTPLLAGLIPFEETDFHLPCVEIRDKLYTNIHILNDIEQNRFCVLFLDISQEVENEDKIQQAKNELHLLSVRHQKLMRKHVGDPVVNRIMQGQSGLNIAGERKQICTMFVDVRAFTVFNESHDSQEVIYTLNQYLQLMIQAVLKQGGIIDKIVGDGIMALFGVLDDQKNIPQLAFNAAKRIQEQVQGLIVERRNNQLQPLGVGIGIATGAAVLGILGDTERQTFSAIGHHVNLAQRLESQARPGEILLDENSYKELNSDVNLTKVELQLKGLRTPVAAYSIQFSQ